MVGNVLGDGPRCAADRSKYSGPCADRPIKFGKLTTRAKIHWCMLCNFQWPCQHCEKDFSRPCPIDFKPEKSPETDRTICSAEDAYEGPCERQIDFGMFNSFTKNEWSEECLAFWPCRDK